MSVAATNGIEDASGQDGIAIVGIGCRFPGGIADAASFWRLLRDGGDAIRPIARDGIDLARWYDPRPRTPGRMMTRFGGFLDDVDLFDAAFFGVSPREAASLDPAQRLLMEATWEACEDATIDPTTLAGERVGVFVGQWLSDFESRLFADPERADFYMTTGSGRYASSGRLSYLLGVTGPSLTLDTACSSSLVAVHLACQSLRTGESRLAIAAGVNVILQPHISIAYSQSGMMAADGHCKFGDAQGDGYVRSEGVGVVLLRPLADAIADGDPVHAVIRGSAVNNDGRGSGHLATPSRTGQAAMLRAAYAEARVSPAHVGYVEAHGTGTRAGDPVELGALGDVLAPGRADGARCHVGSVKTNIGHTEGAAGMAGLLKAVLALKHAEIPASLHFHEPNPAIPWDALPFDIPTAHTPWAATGAARVAGVSAFGITGTNAHVVLEEAPRLGGAPSVTSAGASDQHTSTAEAAGGPPRLLALSASAPAALRSLARAYADRIASDPSLTLTSLCATAARHRAALEHRAVFVADDREALVAQLRAFVAGDTQAARATGRAVAGVATGRVAFVFPGQGGQWDGMARELLATDAVFRAAIARCDAALLGGLGWTIEEQLTMSADDPRSRLAEIGVLQPVLLAVEIALAELWRAWGVAPDAVVGHSMGEVGAAYVAGALSLDDAMRVICARSALLQRTSGAGAMAVLELSADEVTRRIADRASRMCVAVSNGPHTTVVSGNPDAVADFLAECERDGVFGRAVKVDVASHSPQMDPLVPELVATLGALASRATATPWYSTVDAMVIDGATCGATYWGRNLRQPVRFAQTVARMLADGVTAVIEMGPHPTLLASVAQSAPAGAAEPLAVGSMRRGEPERATMLASLGALWAAGHPVAWDRLFPTGTYARVDLPRYPWQRERHWADEALPVSVGDVGRRAPVLDDEKRSWLYVPHWAPTPPSDGGVVRRWLVVATDGDGAGLAAALTAPGATADTATTLDAAIVWALGTAAADRRETGIVFVVDPDAPDLAWNAIAAVRALQAAWPAKRTAPSLWWVTRGAHRVADESLSPRAAEQGALWGAARVIASEYPDWWGGLADLDAGGGFASHTQALAAHLGARRTEDQVAIRGGVRHGLRLTRADAALGAARVPYSWRPDGAYLITGAFGGVAQHVAREMVRQGARRLVLLGRTPLPPRATWAGLAAGSAAAQRVAYVRSLESAGASVHLVCADVVDAAQMRAALDEYRAEGWPPIVGVIHAAAVLATRMIRDMDASAFSCVVGPKLDGALVLDRLLPTLDLFVTFSSMMAFWSPVGEANYAAANAGLDALAAARRARGQHAVSIQWGPWADLGLWKGAAAERNMTALARQGVRSFSADEGVAFLAPLIAAAEPIVSVLPIDWTVLRGDHHGRDLPLYRALAPAGATDTSSGDGLLKQLREAPEANRRVLIEQTVRVALGRVLRRPAAQIDASQPFGGMGLDSLMALELRNHLERDLAHPLSATMAWNYPTIGQLVPYLATVIGNDALADATAERQPATGDPAAMGADLRAKNGLDDLAQLLGDVAQLSDADAALALRGGR